MVGTIHHQRIFAKLATVFKITHSNIHLGKEVEFQGGTKMGGSHLIIGCRIDDVGTIYLMLCPNR